MADAIYTRWTAYTEATITLASLAAGASRQSALISNTQYRHVLVYAVIRSGGTGPAAGGLYQVYLARANADSSPTVVEMGAGSSDAAFSGSFTNFNPIITIEPAATVADTPYAKTAVVRDIGPGFVLIVRNNSSQALDSTEGDHLLGYSFGYDEVQ
jgi:hypothetical protein